jgi:hypothetical protein
VRTISPFSNPGELLAVGLFVYSSEGVKRHPEKARVSQDAACKFKEALMRLVGNLAMDQGIEEGSWNEDSYNGDFCGFSHSSFLVCCFF